MKKWFVYLIKSTKDNSIYTGISTDVLKRIKAHNSNKGAKRTKGRGPWILLKSFECENKSVASKLEIKIKKLSYIEKVLLGKKRL